jgi:hypothetical protein
VVTCRTNVSIHIRRTASRAYLDQVTTGSTTTVQTLPTLLSRLTCVAWVFPDTYFINACRFVAGDCVATEHPDIVQLFWCVFVWIGAEDVGTACKGVTDFALRALTDVVGAPFKTYALVFSH